MSQTLDERARDASHALRTAAATRAVAEPAPRARTMLRVVVTAAVLVVAVSLGAVIAVRSASSPRSGDSRQPGSSTTTAQYRASAVLVATDAKKISAASLRQDALSVTIGAIPRRAAGALHFSGSPARLATQVHTTVNAIAGTITITSTQPTAARAIRVVNTFAEELNRYRKFLFDIQVAEALRRADAVREPIARVQQELNRANTAGKHDPVLQAQFSTLLSQFRVANTKYQNLLGEGAPAYRLVEAANAVQLPPQHDPSTTTRLHTTLVVLGLLALLLTGAGLGYALRGRWSRPVS